MTYDIECPTCGLLHTLQERDLGVVLVCAGCESEWVYDEPLKQRKAEAKAAREQAKAARAEEKRKQAKARVAARAESLRMLAVAQKKHEANKLEMRREEAIRRREAIETEERADQLRNIHGAGCPRCGSANLSQASYITGVGWAFMVLGVALAIFTLGTSLILTLFGFFISEKRARCGKCRWSWRV